MPIAPDPRPGLTQPHTNPGAQKLIKEKVPTHTPVWYQAILLQVIYFHQDKSINHHKFLQTIRSNCTVLVAMSDIRPVRATPSPLPPYPYRDQN